MKLQHAGLMGHGVLFRGTLTACESFSRPDCQQAALLNVCETMQKLLKHWEIMDHCFIRVLWLWKVYQRTSISLWVKLKATSKKKKKWSDFFHLYSLKNSAAFSRTDMVRIENSNHKYVNNCYLTLEKNLCTAMFQQQQRSDKEYDHLHCCI